ncbi:MAG: NAD-dependent epimerase/dehydratase family protein [Clostridia bacterium]|nr:NAD-dependent epimerase/dehydratase family protein [Clostridia bacterium]
MKKIAIMGAGGFVGRALTLYLSGQYEVYPVTRKVVNLLDEVAVASFIKENRIDVVINCANCGGARKNGYSETSANIVEENLRMFYNMERCITPKMKMINFGSGAQYSKMRDLVKIAEPSCGEIIPKDDYGFSKYVMSRYLKHANSLGNIYHIIIFGLYGCYEDYTYKFISNSILKNMLGMPLIINQNVVFDYLYLDDFLDIVKRVIENDLIHKEFNITPTQSIDLVSIVKIINSIGNKSSEIKVLHEGMNYQYTGDNTRLLENMGGAYSFTSYEDGISKLYRWYFEHKDDLDLEAIKEDAALKYCKTK